MIIIGYPGIGKSSISEKNNVVDLESSYFHKMGDNTEWAKSYCDVALDISRQGHVVCISSHPEVVCEIEEKYDKNKDKVYIIFPDMKLKDDWIKKLENRYFKSKNDNESSLIIEKNYRAWNHVAGHYIEDNFRLLSSKLNKYFIDDINYDLKMIIKWLNCLDLKQ